MKKSKKSLLLIGDLPLASEVFKLFITKSDEITIVGVLVQYPNKQFVNDPFDESKNLYEIATEHKVPIYFSCDQVSETFSREGIDIGISCRASIIYRTEFIRLFKRYFINMHGGLLPERAGVNIACHSIIEGDHMGGVTLHIIDEEIDCGPIIDRTTFEISPEDTAFSVYQKSQLNLINLIKKNSDSITTDNLQPKPQSSFSPMFAPKHFRNRDISVMKKLQIDLELGVVDRIVRGCDFPGHEPAYLEIEGKKIYLTTRPFFLREIPEDSTY